jgi:GR25 family glycosyltransferase involved in LPS biosynthesis
MFSINSFPLCDKGFYINLSSCVERDSFVKDQIEKYKISDLHRFEAKTDELRQYSCTKSHRAVFEEALSSNLDSIFVAEDDFEIYNDCYYFNNFSITFNDFINKYSHFINSYKYDVLMFGCNPKKNIIPLNSGFGFNVASTGAWAYIIKKNAMRYILDNYNYYRDYHAIDDILPVLNNKGFTTLTTIPMTIGHRNGIPSTLQPHVGDTYYSGWIAGNWHKHLYENIYTNNSIVTTENILSVLDSQNYLIEQKMTIVISGHCVDNWLFYLRYLLHSMPDELFKCRFIIVYDSCKNDDLYNLHRYFRDIRSNVCPDISFVNGGLISSFDKFLSKIQTEYFLFLEHDWVFLKKDNIDYHNLIQSFDKYSFINAVWFSKNDNTMRAFEICEDNNGKITPFEKETRVSETPLITTCRWSNNPVVFRTSKMREWFDKYINNEHVNRIHQGSQNIEESIIPKYRDEISKLGWENIKDNWGTYLYGNIGDDAYVAHTDGSRRYQGISKSQPEINGENYIANNPLLD